MLVLTRKKNEGIRVEGPADITILSIQGNRVRLGIEAAEEVVVRRLELLGALGIPVTPSDTDVKVA